MHDPILPAQPFLATLGEPFSTAAERERFAELVRGWFQRRGRGVTIEPGPVAVDDEGTEHGLRNLAQVCAQAAAFEWPGLIAAHLAKNEPAHLAAVTAPLLEGDYDEVAERLAVRIYPADGLAQELQEATVCRTDLPGTISMLVLDGRETVSSVPRPVAEEWAVPDDDLFAQALSNLARRPGHWRSYVLRHTPTPLDCFSGDFYAASRILCAGGLRRVGAHGNLVAVPNRAFLLSYPLDALQSLAPIEALARMAHDRFQQGPGSISPHLWWRTPEGILHLQQTSLDGDRIRLAPSSGFLALHERLRGAPGAGG